MPICQKELDALLAEIERLKLENALLREETDEEPVHVSADERQALLRKTV